MTVLGGGKEKDDKEQLVTKGHVATIMPNRIRLVRIQRRRTLITLILSIGFIFILLCGVFLTVCYIKKIGPFRRHFSGHCTVGHRRFNGHKNVFESYEITDKYSFINVPRFNIKQGTYKPSRILHVFDKKLSVIQHNNMCLVKPMMRYQYLRNDWFERLRKLSHHKIHTPSRMAYFHMRIIRPALPGNYLNDEVHPLAGAMCGDRPVFRLVFRIRSSPDPWNGMCHIKCDNCDRTQQLHKLIFIDGKMCSVCQCNSPPLTKTTGSLKSSNQVEPNCKTIRCENKCIIKHFIGCVQCRCADAEQVQQSVTTQRSSRLQQNPIDTRIPAFPVTSLETKARQKRSLDSECKIVAKIYEGYTPVDNDRSVPLNFIYDC